jgi:hypothetical protein
MSVLRLQELAGNFSARAAACRKNFENCQALLSAAAPTLCKVAFNWQGLSSCCCCCRRRRCCSIQRLLA